MSALSQFGKALGALAKPAIAELSERGTAQAPVVLEEALAKGNPVGKRGAKIPFQGNPELEDATRATALEQPSLEDRVQSLKTFLGSAFRADPNLPKDVQKTFYRGRWRSNAADAAADLDLQEVYKPLQGDAPRQATTMMDYLITKDEVAQAARAKKETIHGEPAQKWVDQLSQLQPLVDADPQIQEAITRRLGLFDKLFDDMVNRGWIVPEHYLEDYTPIRKIHAVAKGLAAQGGEDLQSYVLGQTKHRTGAEGARETNLVVLERKLLSEYYKKVAEHETFIDLLNDKTINFTEHFKPGDVLPKNLAVYRPGPGMMGYMRKSEDGYLIDGITAGLGIGKNELTSNGYVFPKALVEALNRYHPPTQNVVENKLYRSGRAMSKWLTVFNPANTHLNVLSDLPLAMMGLPGERAQPLGVFKWYMKVGAPASAKGAFGKGGTLIKIGNQTVDVWELAQREGLTEGTIHHDVAGGRISDELARLLPAEERQTMNPVLDAMQKERLAAEAAPRIAAGLEAWERTGNKSEFGRVGREITLPYGPGAPLATKFPAVKLISPFLQFVGLASARVNDLVRAPESRNRALAGLMAVPTITYMWNTQNDEYKQVEDSLAEWERSQAHVIVPDPTDPGKVRRDVNGKPLVFRFRYWVPEDIMRTAGLGNIVARGARVVEGKDTPQKFAASIPQEAAENISSLLTIPGLVKNVATGKTDTGREMKWPERITRLFPVSHAFTEGAAAAQDHGAAEGATRFAQEIGGVRFASVSRKGKHLRNSDFVAARQKLAETRARWKNSMLNGPPSKAKEARDDYYKAVEELKRISAQMKKEKADAAEQAP